MVQAVIFDCFGVVISDALSVLCSELASDDPDALRSVWSLMGRANRGQLSSEDSSTQIARIFGLTLAEYRAKLAAGEVKDQTLLDYIAELRKTYKTAMLSNVPVGSLARRFDEDELKRYFDAVVASGDISYAKPDARAYEITADTLGVPPDACVFVDDRARYTDGAEMVGMQALLYENFSEFRTAFEALVANS